MDRAGARRAMLDGQLRPNRVTDLRLLAAMLDLPRERFLPPTLAGRAYADEAVPLPGGRALLSPMVLARLIQLAEVRPDDRVLVVGAGTGYGAAVLARMGARVTALEDAAELSRIAAAAWATCLAAGAVRPVAGPLIEGWAAGAPYEAILLEGEVPAVPAALTDQLAAGGRLATVIGDGRSPGRGSLIRRLGGANTTTIAFDAAGVPLPAFLPAPAFEF